MIHYFDAPDREKGQIVADNWERMEQDIFDCIDDPGYTNNHVMVTLYYDAQDWYNEMRVSPAMLLALHRLGLVQAAREYRFTLEDITDDCMTSRCYAERMIRDIPILEGYQYDYVRSLME